MIDQPNAKRYALARLDDIEPVACPCGQSRRAFRDGCHRFSVAYGLGSNEVGTDVLEKSND